MSDIETAVTDSLRDRADGEVGTEALLSAALRRGRVRRRHRRFLAAAGTVLAVGVLTSGVGVLPAVLADGGARVAGGGPAGTATDQGAVATAPGAPGSTLAEALDEPTALVAPERVGADPALVHFAADELTGTARVVKWHSGPGVEGLHVDVGGFGLVHVDVGPELPALDQRIREGAATGVGNLSDTTVRGRPATLERIRADGAVAWVLRWQPVDGLWARVGAYGATSDTVLRAAEAVRFDEVRRCAVPFRLTTLVPDARVLSCDLSVGAGSTDAALVIGDGRGASMEVQVQYVPRTGAGRSESNTTVGGRRAFAYPGNDELELLDFPDTYVSARIGKAYAGYAMDDARTVLAGLRMADPAHPSTWPERFVG